MLTSPSPSTAVIRARAPGSSGISTCQHRHAGAHRRLRREPQSGLLRPLEDLLDRRCVAPTGSRRAAASSRATNNSIAVDDLIAVRDEDRAPERGLRCRQPREISEPARGQQQELRLVRLLSGGKAHQRRRRDLREMAHHRHEPIVALRRQSHGPRARRVRSRPRARRSARVPVAACGATTHTMPSRTEAEACSGPERSLPPIGWPGTYRAQLWSPTPSAASTSADDPLLHAARRR